MLKNGYGQLWWQGKMRLAHRLSYENYIDEIPDGMLVCHKCDNRKCINPNHLFVGTQSDNRNDMYQKGRGVHRKGERHHNHKFTEDDVIFIRSSDIRNMDLAEKFNVSRSAISDIRCRRRWKHI